MVQQDLVDYIENANTANTDIEEKVASKEAKIGKRATDNKEFAFTGESKAADEDTLNNPDTGCKHKTASFEEGQNFVSV